MEADKKLNAIIIGATGAVGRENINYLLMNENYEKITILVRRVIESWEKLDEAKKQKLNSQSWKFRFYGKWKRENIIIIKW